MRVRESISASYRKVARHPGLLKREPWLLALLPVFVFIFIRKRWNTEPETIFLTETGLQGSKLLSEESESSCKLVKYHRYEEVRKEIGKRVAEEGIKSDYDEEVKGRFAQGDYMIGLLRNGVVVSYLFISEKQANFLQVGYSENLPSLCYAVYDVYTFESFRGRGFYEILLAKTAREMVRRNFESFWLWVMRHNQLSLKVHQKLGVNKVIRIYTQYFRFGMRHFKEKRVDFLLSELIG